MYAFVWESALCESISTIPLVSKNFRVLSSSSLSDWRRFNFVLTFDFENKHHRLKCSRLTIFLARLQASAQSPSIYTSLVLLLQSGSSYNFSFLKFVVGPRSSRILKFKKLHYKEQNIKLQLQYRCINSDSRTFASSLLILPLTSKNDKCVAIRWARMLKGTPI